MSDEKTSTDKPAGEPADDAGRSRRRLPAFNQHTSVNVNKVRSVVGRAVWILTVVFALVLALAALLAALDANADNRLVEFIGTFSDDVDLGFFDLGNPIKDFDDSKQGANDTKTLLFNYGLAAVAWLLIGKILERIIRP